MRPSFNLPDRRKTVLIIVWCTLPDAVSVYSYKLELWVLIRFFVYSYKLSVKLLWSLQQSAHTHSAGGHKVELLTDLEVKFKFPPSAALGGRSSFFCIRNNTVAQRYRSYARYQNKDQAAALAFIHPN